MDKRNSVNEDSNNSRIHFGFCLPCPLDPAEGNQGYSNHNPFPEINPSSAYMILPIKAYWFPKKYNLSIVDQTIYASHEAIHLSSANSSLTYYALSLVQFQYLAIWQTLYEGGKIFVPSLHDPMGWVKKAQVAINQVARPMACVQELMATTLPHFLSEQGVLLSTIHLNREAHLALHKHYPNVLPSPSNCPCCNNANRMTYMNCFPEMAERIEYIVKKSWYPTYNKGFADYNFECLSKRLLNVWRTIAKGTSQDFLQLLVGLVVLLARYPFDIPMQVPKGFWWPSWQADFEAKTNYVTKMSQEPVKRLHTLLTTVENANIHGVTNWFDYLLQNLPGFKVTLEGSNPGFATLSYFSSQLWQQHDFPEFGLAFQATYRQPYEATMTINFDHQPIISDQKKWPGAARILILTEAMRQWVVHEKCPTCLCSKQIRSNCDMKIFLEVLWQSIAPDSGKERWFAKNSWQKPECVMEWLASTAEKGGLESIEHVAIRRRGKAVRWDELIRDILHG